VLGFLEAYTIVLPATHVPITETAYSTEYLIVYWLSLAVSYPATVLVFYAIGRRQTSFRAGRSILMIYGSALLGEILGQTVFSFLPQSNPFTSFSFYVTAPSSSLGFVFIAFSGFALSNLSRGTISNGTRNKFMLVALASLVFGVLAGSLYSDFSFLARLGLTAQLFPFSIIALLSFVIALPGRFVVFYLIGRRVPVNGHTLAYFGLLFVGTYIGSVIGAVVSVALFGKAYWTLAPGQGSSNTIEGFVLVNIPPSLLVLFEALDPIASLPFLSFFAMSISRTFNISPSAPGVGLPEPHPTMQPAPAASQTDRRNGLY
jgi:hypothetical protein